MKDCEAPTPQEIRGKTLTGSTLSLDAIGPQDKHYLVSNNSPFLPEYKNSYPNAIFQRRTQFGEPSTSYFGNTVKHVFKPREMGDLLANMYLKTNLPLLAETGASSNVQTRFPTEYSLSIAPGKSATITNSELKRLDFGSTTIVPYENGVGFSNNEPVSNTQYTGTVESITDVPVGFFNIYGHTLGSNVFNAQTMKITDTNDASFELTANLIVTDALTQDNASVVDGGLKSIHIKDRATVGSSTGAFSLREPIVTLSSSTDYSLLLESNLVGHKTTMTPTETYTDLNNSRISMVNVKSKYDKFPYSTNNFSITCPSVLKCNIATTYSAASFPITSAFPLDINPSADSSNLLVHITGNKYRYDNRITLEGVTGQSNWLQIFQRLTGTDGLDAPSFTIVGNMDFNVIFDSAATVAANDFRFQVEETQGGSFGYTWAAYDSVGGVLTSTKANGNGDGQFKITQSFTDTFITIKKTGTKSVYFMHNMKIDGSFVNLNAPVILSNIEVAPTVISGSNVFTVGSDFAVQYYDTGLFSNSFGASNVSMNDSGFNTSVITLDESYENMYIPSNVSSTRNYNNLLLRTDFNPTPSTATSLSATDADPKAGTLSYYSNCQSDHFTNDIGYKVASVTSSGSRLSNIYFENISTSVGDYRTDGSFDPLLEITNASRSTIVNVGVIQQGSNGYIQHCFQVTQGTSTITVPSNRSAFIGYGSGNTHSFSVNLSYGSVSNSTSIAYGSSSQLLVNLNNWNGDAQTLMTKTPQSVTGIPDDTAFLQAMKYGALTITKVSQAVSNISYGLCYPKLEVYAGLTRYVTVNLYSSTTTIQYPGNTVGAAGQTLTVTNGSNTWTKQLITDLGLVQSNVNSIVYGGASHLTCSSNVAGSNFIYPSSSGDLGGIITVRPTKYLSTTIAQASNGYSNIISGQYTYGPLAVQDENISTTFNEANVTVTSSYGSQIIPAANLTSNTITTIIQPTLATTGGEFFVKEVTSTLNYSVNGISNASVNVTGTNEYDVIFDSAWQSNIVAIRNNNVCIITNMDIVATQSNLETFNTSNATITIDDTYTVANIIGTTTQEIVSSKQNYSNTLPYSFVDIKLSTGNEADISYLNTNTIEVFAPESYGIPSNYTFSLSGSALTSAFSGPMNMDVPADYQSNVTYTEANTAIYVNGGYYTSTGPMKTYNPNTFVKMTTYPNTFVINNTTVSANTS